jgi:hypothetical protein
VLPLRFFVNPPNIQFDITFSPFEWPVNITNLFFSTASLPRLPKLSKTD